MIEERHIENNIIMNLSKQKVSVDFSVLLSRFSVQDLGGNIDRSIWPPKL